MKNILHINLITQYQEKLTPSPSKKRCAVGFGVQPTALKHGHGL